MPIKKIFFFSLFLMFSACQAESVITETTIENPLTPEVINLPVIETESFNQEKTVRLAWFYKPPEDGTSLETLAQRFDTFILTHYDEDERDELRNLGVETPFLEYLLFVQIQDPGSCDKEPYGNQVAYKIGDFCEISVEHPDWFLRDKKGDIIRKGKNVFMDPGNQEYREFWLERAKELRENYGWDGIFIDNLEASLKKFERLDVSPKKYPSDESYQAAIEEFLIYIDENYFGAENIPVYANIIEYEDPDIWLSYIDSLDGAMIEDFALGYNDEYYSESDWIEQLMMALEAQSMGKFVILVSQGEMEDTDRERFALASYLLVNNGNASFRYTESSHYEEVWLYENYFLSLGKAQGNFYEVAQGWRRDFEKGYVFVDPNSHKSIIQIDE